MSLRLSSVAKRLQAERRPEECALKVTSRSITLHELARAVPVVDTLIPGIGPRMHGYNESALVLVFYNAVHVTL